MKESYSSRREYNARDPCPLPLCGRANSEVLESDHKQRLLAKLETLQSELHKKVSNLDRFIGFMSEAGIRYGCSDKI